VSRGPLQYVVERGYAAAMRSRTIRNGIYGTYNKKAFTDVFEHEKMLADHIRVDAYAAALDRLVGPDDVVVDLGTGTGILAMLAARRARRVYAIDHSPFIEVAERAAAHNGFDNITFLQQHSSEFDPPEPVDVVVHEQMGDELLNENMLENLLDLRRRVMAPGGRILPARFALYVEPVTLQEDQQTPFLWEMAPHGLDFGFLRGDTSLTENTRRSYGWRRIPTGGVSHLLGAPEPVVTFDIDTLVDIDEVRRDVTFDRTVVQGGWLDGLCVWFTAEFGEGVSLSTSPLEPRTSWTNRLVRTPRRKVEAGEAIRYRVRVDDLVRPRTWTMALVDA